MDVNRPRSDESGPRVPLGDSGEVSDIVAQARNRNDGFQYGDDRAIAARPNWEAHDSEQLYRYATVNNDPGSAEEVGQGWSAHSGELHRAADDLYSAISELGAAWIGQGAGAAQGALVTIANSTGQAAEAANTMSSRLAQQAAAAAKLKTMPQPKEFDPAAETAAMLAGGPAAMVGDLKPRFDAAREVKAQQVAFLEAYTAELAEIDGATPSFGPESLGLKPMAGGTNSGMGNVAAAGSYGGPGMSVTGLGTTPVAAGLGDGVSASALGAGAPGATANAQGQGPAQPPTPQHGPPGGTGASPAAPAHAPGAGGGPTAGQALGAAVAGGALGYAGARALSKGSRSGSTKKQSSETAASANQQSAPVAPAQGQGQVAPGSPVGAGQVPPTTGAPMTGMGAAGGGTDDEKEHTHASFLIEPDPDDTFGATESTAPPVLGAWGPDDEGR
ncbi:uncharacterized protein YukE [Saccharomonospora amisosensis]|uniref:Uncharacterized protein YukE n=1 Tax=Saccharomonospora amisosensis TaxID=1128677 RepID=A0A7X5ULA3_9PSEU|nr:hypothetical protein [Saccharomonospora amisosensis]NIJ10086.1 uncharacterized protein YukE [Saccharomonospora amisosensis]